LDAIGHESLPRLFGVVSGKSVSELVVHSKVQYLPSVIDVNDWNGQEGIGLGIDGRKFCFQTNRALACLMLMAVYVCGSELVNDMLLAVCRKSIVGAEVVLWYGQEFHTDTRLPCIFVTDLSIHNDTEIIF
jgi:hypothetical protein